MKTYILQHGTSEYNQILDLVKGNNEKYSQTQNIEYVSNISQLCTNDRKQWQKLTYISNFLDTVQDQSLVVWLDIDSLCIGTQDIKSIISTDSKIGMVRMYGGHNDMQKVPNRHNAGVIAIRNCQQIKNLIKTWLTSQSRTDQDAFYISCKNGVKIFDIDPKWNCWNNNYKLCKNKQILTWHGYNLSDKLRLIKEYIKQKGIV